MEKMVSQKKKLDSNNMKNKQLYYLYHINGKRSPFEESIYILYTSIDLFVSVFVFLFT